MSAVSRILILTRYRPGTHGGLGTLLANLKNSCTEQCDVSFYIVDIGLSSSSIMKSMGPLSTIYTFLRDLTIGAKNACSSYTDAVLYVGSVPLPSHLFAKMCHKPVILYVNGYLHHEHIYRLRNALRHANIKELLGSLWTEIWTELLFGIGRFYVDLYVFPCYGTYEFSKIPSNKAYKIIPLWLSENDITKAIFEQKNALKNKNNNDVLLVAYTSNVYSPKILDSDHLIKLGHLIRRKSKRSFKFLIIDPKSSKRKHVGNTLIINKLPRGEYLKLLTKSVLYVDCVIDDELRYSTLESMLLGIPVAKITHPRYWDKLDFKYELFSTSVPEFVEKIAWYIDHVEELYPKYSLMVREYVLHKRTWNSVKQIFLEALNPGDRH